MKPCSKCGVVKPLNEFDRSRRKRSGYQSRCKECLRPYQKAYYAVHRTELLAHKARYDARKRAERLAAAVSSPPATSKTCTKCGLTKALDDFAQRPLPRHGYTSRCRACLKADCARYYSAHSAKERARKVVSHAAKRAAGLCTICTQPAINGTARCADHTAYQRKRNRSDQATRRARALAVPGIYTAADVTQMYADQHGLCFYCGTSLASGYHVEHKIPLGRSGATNWPGNLSLSCPRCNHRKYLKTAQEFLALLAHEAEEPPSRTFA